MSYFITAKSRIEQTDKDGYWKLIDNELYLSNNNELTITPRYFWTDGYTFPLFIIPFIGDKNKYDVRPAHGHDLFCRFHQKIKVNLSLIQLKQKGILHEHKGMIVCEDIPEEYLSIEKISKFESNNLLREMMLTCDIPRKTCNIVRFGTIFNINWINTGKKSLKDYRIFKEDIGLINGL